MAFHHVVKFLVNLLVFLLSAWSENVGGVCVRALAASVLLLVQSLHVKTKTGGSTEHMKSSFIETFATACACQPSQSQRRRFRSNMLSLLWFGVVS